MEDFEYSVEICDRDWDCFFAECEECNLLPPSIAGLDDSGMSDIDDTRSILAKRFQGVDPTASLSEADCLIDDPLDCEGSPVEHYLSKHGLGGMESILSGSEEDLHLQSVNIFFERLKSGTEAEGLTECSQVRDGKNRGQKKEEEKCSDGQGASSSVLPKNSLKSNPLPASGEAGFGKETTEPVDAISNVMKTIKQEKSVSNSFPEPSASDSVIKTEKSAHSTYFIREDAGTIARKNDGTKWNQSCASRVRPVLSETTTHTDKVVKMDMYTAKDDIQMEHMLPKQVTVSKKSSTDSWGNVETLNNNNCKDEPNLNVLQPEAPNTNKIVCLESSPSASLKRKRRKKRRLSVEAESVHGHERQVSVKQSDSEEEQRAWKGGAGLFASENFHFSYLNQPQKTVMPSLTSYPATINLPMKISSKDMNVNNLSHYGGLCADHYQDPRESIVRHTGSMEHSAQNETLLSQTSRNVMSIQNNRGCVESNFKSCCGLLEEPVGLNENPGLPVLITGLVTGTSPLGGSLWQPNDNNQTITYKNEHKKRSCTAEVASITNSVLRTPESNDLAVDVCQNDKLSAAKSVLAAERGNSGRNKHTLCQREAEAQQQLEIGCHYSDQYSTTLGKTKFPLSATGTSSSEILNTRPKPMKMNASPPIDKMSCPVDCAKLTWDTISSLPEKCCQSISSPCQERNMTVQQTEPQVLLSKHKFDSLLDKETVAERDEVETPQIMSVHTNKPVLPGRINQIGNSERETSLSDSEDSQTSPTDVTPVLSCCTHNTESEKPASNDNITDISGSSHLSASQNDSESQREKTSTLLTKHGADGSCTLKSESVSEDTTDLKFDSLDEADEAMVSKAEYEPENASETKHPVFAISSFWNEMEKLTINDILGLRRINKTPPFNSLSPLQEIEETGVLPMTDSGFFTQLDECKPEQINEDTDDNTNNPGLSSGSVMEVSSSSLKAVTWEKEPVTLSPAADVYPKNMTLTSDNPEPVLPGMAQTCLRRISKNVSVHHLPALESKSFNYAWKGQTLQTSDKGGLEKVEYFTNGQTPTQDKDCVAPSSTGSFKISLTNIFQSLFGGKKSLPSPSSTDTITSQYTCGNSVSESYDYFFSEFDTESLFQPLITTENQAKDEMVPIFSCSRSANKTLQYPETYEQFFASSSDDSSDDEDNYGPVRVVTRFTRTSSASQICTDIYDNFFTDKDLKQNFFWKNTLSFRNVNFSGSTPKKQTLSNLVSSARQRQSDRSSQRIVSPINAFGDQDVMIPDPLLYHLEDRISRQLLQQPFIHEDLQMAVANPSKLSLT